MVRLRKGTDIYAAFDDADHLQHQRSARERRVANALGHDVDVVSTLHLGRASTSQGCPEGPYACAFHSSTSRGSIGIVTPAGTFYVDPRKSPDFAWAFTSRFMFVLAYAFLTTYQAYYLLDKLGTTTKGITYNVEREIVEGLSGRMSYVYKNARDVWGELDAVRAPLYTVPFTFVDPGPVNRLPSLLSGAVDAAILSPEERYAAIDQGMKDLMFMGKEVKNSWGTIATSDRFIKEQPKVMAGFARAVVKALRFVRHNREGAIAAATKFTELDNALVIRMYDDIAKTFTANGVVDEEAQRNDLAIVREIAGVSEVVPIQRAYDFSFARQADQQLTKAGWKP